MHQSKLELYKQHKCTGLKQSLEGGKEILSSRKEEFIPCWEKEMMLSEQHAIMGERELDSGQGKCIWK